MRIQITLTSAAAKRMIAKGIKVHPRVQEVRKRGKIVLKGGTTTSAISEELCGKPMKMAGMITPKGTLTSQFRTEVDLPHALMLQGNKIIRLFARQTLFSTIMTVAHHPQITTTLKLPRPAPCPPLRHYPAVSQGGGVRWGLIIVIRMVKIMVIERFTKRVFRHRYSSFLAF